MKVSSRRRSWRDIVNAAALSAMLQGSSPTTVAECTFADDPQQRVVRIVDNGTFREPRWWLTLRSGPLGDRVVELPLPNAQVELSSDRFTLSSASKNGGLAVEISVSPHRPIFDVFVNFELEVNVWRDLSPEVDQLNTGGPDRRARCRIVSGFE